MKFEEYNNIEKIIYNILKGLFFDDIFETEHFSIYKSNILLDEFSNYTIINNEDLLYINKNALIEIEKHFENINRKPCVYLPIFIKNYSKYKKYLEENGYVLKHIDSFMILEEHKDYETDSNIEYVKTNKSYKDFMDVLESAYSGEISEENPYAGAITKEYYGAIYNSLKNKKFNHIILYKNKIPVSVATFSIETGYCMINSVGTKKEFQNKGLGTEIIKECIKKFNELNGKYLFLATEFGSKNEKWYKKLGFKTLFVEEIYVKE